MLDYLDSLCAALLARNGTEIRRLLRHPLGARPAKRSEAGLPGGAERAGEERQIEMPLPLRAAGG